MNRFIPSSAWRIDLAIVPDMPDLETVLAPIWVWLIFAEAPTNMALAGGAILILALGACGGEQAEEQAKRLAKGKLAAKARSFQRLTLLADKRRVAVECGQSFQSSRRVCFGACWSRRRL